MDATLFRCSVPARAGSVRVLRAVVRGAASDLDLSYDVLDEIGLALDEAGAALLELDGEGTLVCQGTRAGTGLRVSVALDGTVEGSWPPLGWESSLGAIVLHSVAQDVEYSVESDRPTVAFVAGRAS